MSLTSYQAAPPRVLKDEYAESGMNANPNFGDRAKKRLAVGKAVGKISRQEGPDNPA
jgi:hypothetical protein